MTLLQFGGYKSLYTPLAYAPVYYILLINRPTWWMDGWNDHTKQ